MECERGDHGDMFIEQHPTVYRCETCGHMAYPQYSGNVADDAGSGAHRYLSPKAKKQRKAIIESFVEKGYTNQEVSEVTGYSFVIVRREARDVRKRIGKA